MSQAQVSIPVTDQILRVGDIRRSWRSGDLSREGALGQILQWSRTEERLIFEGEDPEGLKHLIASPMAKRGNEPYRVRVDRRFSGFEDLIERDVQIDPKAGTTNTVFATFTFDRMLLDLETSWETVGHSLESCHRKLQSSFGEFDFLRVWQSHADGYPHVHAILAFRFARFKTFVHKDKIRVEDPVKQRFESAWPFGFVDVEVPRSVAEVRTHILRYIERGMFVDEPVRDSTGIDTSDRSGEIVLEPGSPENPFSIPVRIARSTRSDYQSVRRTEYLKQFASWNAFNDAMARNAANLTLFRKRSFGLSRQWSRGLKELQTARLDNAPCITRRFAPLQNVHLVGFASLGLALAAAKVSIPLEEARNKPFELQDSPGIRAMLQLEAAPRDDLPGALITRGAAIAIPGSLDVWTPEYQDAFDELTARQRARLLKRGGSR